jgi:hypothetical protein
VTRATCPVGELAGDPHEYVAGDGVVIPWDVAGDPRPGVEACRGCVSVIDQDYDNARRCESCGVTGGGVENGRCEACTPTGDPVADYLRENGYATIDDWAADSDYVRNDDGEWCDNYGSFDVRARLLSVIEERRLSDE